MEPVVCPFCGGKRLHKQTSYSILCLDCGAVGRDCSSCAVVEWGFSIEEKDWREYKKGRRYEVVGNTIVITNKRLMQLEGKEVG